MSCLQYFVAGHANWVQLLVNWVQLLGFISNLKI